MVSSSFNIPYQSTGVGSLSSLDSNELKWSVQGLIWCIEFDIIVVQKKISSSWFFPQSLSTVHRYPHRNSTTTCCYCCYSSGGGGGGAEEEEEEAILAFSF